MALSGRATNDPSNYFALGVQGAKDQDAGTFYYFKHLDGTGFDVAFDISSEREGGAGREVGLRYKTMVKADGQVITYSRPDVAGRLLTWTLGADVPTTIASITGGQFVQHTITPGGSLPYLTADQGWADEVERTTNCVITELDIEGEAGHPVKFTAQFMSGGSPHVATAALTPSRETGDPHMFPNASAYLITGGASSIELTKYKVGIKNTVDDAIQTLGLNREDVIWEAVDFDIDGTIKYTDKKIWESANYLGGTQVAIPLATATFQFYTQQLGSSNSLLIGAPLLQIGQVKVNRLDPDGKTMYLDFTASTIKNATNSLYAIVYSGATGAYTATAT